MDAKLTRHRNGPGVGWAVGGVAASLVIGILIEPFRRTIGLENVTIVYLTTVVVTAAFGGRGAGLLTAVAAALSYDFFLTTPYHSLVIDLAAQVITVVLLLVTGLAGQARRHLTLAVDEQAELLGLLNTVAQAAANGDGVIRSPPSASASSWTPAASRSSEPVTPACTSLPMPVIATCHLTPATCSTSTNKAAPWPGSTCSSSTGWCGGESPSAV